MPEMQFKTKNNSSPAGKPRVYFTCHPEDFELSFDKICEDIFKTHDCVIYYTPDMTEEIPEADKETDLGSNNLFVIPVTLKLLTTQNRAMDSDFAYAKAHDIPVLPFLFEAGIDTIYGRADKFDKMQYLNPLSTDQTEISYHNKLKRFLERILISDELASQVRSDFDAYIFLSYRKKDRRYANELMRLIHEKPEYRDIAIWYDEFLTPGESFQENIEKILKESKLFTLLVTPNLLEEPNGKPNFVMGEEYPAAIASGMEILPVEMVKTDKKELKQKYHGIKKCANPYKARAFQKQLLKKVAGMAVTKNDNDPKHLFLMGLAYYEGIDVELDRDRGLALLFRAADAGWEDAIVKLKRLADAFHDIGNYQKSMQLYQQVHQCCQKKYGKDDTSTLAALSNLALEYSALGNYYKALVLLETAYAAMSSKLGETHPSTLSALHSLASIYHRLGEHQKAFELREKVYELRCETLGANHPSTLASLHNLASTYSSLGKYREALALQEKAYAAQSQALGEEHPDSITFLHNLALSYDKVDQSQKALEAEEKVYALRCQILGEEHPDTLVSLHNLASFHGKLGNYQKTLELQEKAYQLYCKILGENHPDSLFALSNLAVTYNRFDHKKALAAQETAYAKMCRVLGEEHPKTIASLMNLATVYLALGDREKCLEMQDRAYRLNCQRLGKEHPDTLVALSNLAYTYNELGDHQKALQMLNEVYLLRKKSLGEDHSDTLDPLHYMAMIHEKLGNFQESLDLYEEVYAICCKLFGADSARTAGIAKTMQTLRQKLNP